MRSLRKPIHVTPATDGDYAESAEQLVQWK